MWKYPIPKSGVRWVQQTNTLVQPTTRKIWNNDRIRRKELAVRILGELLLWAWNYILTLERLLWTLNSVLLGTLIPTAYCLRPTPWDLKMSLWPMETSSSYLRLATLHSVLLLQPLDYWTSASYLLGWVGLAFLNTTYLGGTLLGNLRLSPHTDFLKTPCIILRTNLAGLHFPLTTLYGYLHYLPFMPCRTTPSLWQPQFDNISFLFVQHSRKFPILSPPYACCTITAREVTLYPLYTPISWNSTRMLNTISTWRRTD